MPFDKLRAHSTSSGRIRQAQGAFDKLRASTWASRLGSGQFAEYRLQIFGAGSYCRDRPFVFGFFGEDRVLFEGVPAAVAVCPEVSDDGGYVDVSLTQWPIHSLSHSLAVGELAGLHPRRNR